MTSYLHYNQPEMHFEAEDLLIGRQCQSLHEGTETDGRDGFEMEQRVWGKGNRGSEGVLAALMGFEPRKSGLLDTVVLNQQHYCAIGLGRLP